MIQLNGHDLTFETYPNGETKVPRLYEYVNTLEGGGLDVTTENEVFFKWREDADLVKLVFVLNYLHVHRLPIHLEIAYMPYSRMDRLEGGPEWELPWATALHAAESAINSCVNHYVTGGRITVWDPHSEATQIGLGASSVYPAKQMFLKLAKQVGFNPVLDYIVWPDEVAVKRYGPFDNGLYNAVA